MYNYIIYCKCTVFYNVTVIYNGIVTTPTPHLTPTLKPSPLPAPLLTGLGPLRASCLDSLEDYHLPLHFDPLNLSHGGDEHSSAGHAATTAEGRKENR